MNNTQFNVPTLPQRGYDDLLNDEIEKNLLPVFRVSPKTI